MQARGPRFFLIGAIRCRGDVFGWLVAESWKVRVPPVREIKDAGRGDLRTRSFRFSRRGRLKNGWGKRNPLERKHLPVIRRTLARWAGCRTRSSPPPEEVFLPERAAVVARYGPPRGGSGFCRTKLRKRRTGGPASGNPKSTAGPTASAVHGLRVRRRAVFQRRSVCRGEVRAMPWHRPARARGGEVPGRGASVLDAGLSCPAFGPGGPSGGRGELTSSPRRRCGARACSCRR